ncbi:E3 ubiquitin-protein ligase [Tripterygium wilfordii]|uniref:RING-type E3 ubiquitin transferase n=1 Tax=Tripterygium wilfordii TaxID=458696 RepID=A0A7J7BVG6_TRIWF|nr:E3 ubiquitin-protein ligase SIRP1-like [Tripterygium wilfordii]XP_038695927.1 E3 ubiquitin-protein ligase SIRP1-like [Tripterygium wilfordii]KAF5725536.1 E3 ubiquitin-protein ligase [Tripterygium wilfordii]
MDEAMVARYWCHMCSQMVNPIMEIEIKCPFCQSGFVEEMGATAATRDGQDPDPDFGSDRALSLWAPILLGMMGNPRRRFRRFRRMGIDDDFDDNDDEVNDNGEARHEGESELDHELESIVRRRRRSSGAILQWVQGIRSGMIAEANNNSEGENRFRDRNRERERERERERVILINPFNQTIIVQGSYDSSGGQNQNQGPIGSLGDYFMGPGLDLLLQHLAENDPNRYGTPPAQKEAIEAMPTVTIKENLQCSVCLDDFEISTEAKEMPCKHKFHNACILPWLELHSSCPVCRFQLPSDASKLDPDRSRSSSNQRENDNSNDRNGHSSNGGEAGDVEGRSGGGRRFSIPWPFNGLFSSSGGNSSSTSSASSNAAGSSSQTDEN